MERVITINFILLSLFFNMSYGQTYVFDKIVKNKFSFESFINQERNNLINSKDYSYHMQIYSQNDTLKSRIFDTKNNQVHDFYLENSDFLNFFYLNTYIFKKQDLKYTYEFSDIKTFKDNNEIILTIFNKKKKIAKYNLVIQESNFNFFPIFNLTSMEPFHMMKIIPPSNFTVISSKGKNISRRTIKYELTSIEDMYLEIQLPEILISK